MPVPDFESFKVGNGELSSATKFNNFVQQVEDEFGDIDRDQLSTETRKHPISLHLAAAGQPQLSDGVTTDVTWVFHIPDDYVSGDITIKLLFHGSTTNGGTAVLRRSLYRYRSGVAFTTIDSAVNANLTGFTVNVVGILSSTLAAANFAAGDGFEVQMSRLGADGSDTYTGAVVLDGGWIEYTGRA